VAKKYYPRIDFPELTAESPFNWLYPWITINNNGRTIFSGTLVSSPSSAYLSTPKNTETGGHDLASDYYYSGSAGGIVDLFPMVTDNPYTCVRGGGSSTSPLLLFNDETLSSAWYIAEPPDFTMIAEKPSVSDDGVFVAFMGTHQTLGGGIFGDIGYGPFEIAGIPGDGLIALYPEARVGVNRSLENSPNKYTVVYLANRQETDVLGLYVTKVDTTIPTSPNFSEPDLVIEVGNELLDWGTIEDIKHYDPINNSSQLAFWVRTTEGQAIVCATPRPVLLIHGWRGNKTTWDPLIVELEKKSIPYHNFDYEDLNTESPSVIATRLANWIEELRNDPNTNYYQGKYDIVCHSMGAMVSRYYMEVLLGCQEAKKNIHQWIGLGPVNSGAKLADLENLMPHFLGWILPDPIWEDEAVKAMKLKSSILAKINYNLPDFDEAIWGTPQQICGGIIYRNLMGINENQDRNFSFFGGKTLTAIKGPNGKIDSYASFQGDGVVGMQQSLLVGDTNWVGNEVFEGRVHSGTEGINQHPEAIDKVISYLLNPNQPVINSYPQEDPSSDHFVLGNVNQGYIYGTPPKMFNNKKDNANNQVINFSIDSGTTETMIHLTWKEGELEMVLVSPSQIIIDPNVHAGVEYYSQENTIFYIITNPEIGTWEANITVLGDPNQDVQYSFATLLSNPLLFNAFTADARTGYYLSDDVIINAELKNDDDPVTQAIVEAEIRTPSHIFLYLDLYDNGSHGDQDANDGIYSAVFHPNEVGSFQIDLNASGLNNGSFFERFTQETIWIRLAGDIDGNQQVDLYDFAEISEWWLQDMCTERNRCQSRDINNNGYVDLYDILSLSENWLAGIE
jgi:pimeloyl-ACP methyl ester carboxylesterase